MPTPKRVIIYMDANGTAMPGDTAKGEDDEFGAFKMIAENTPYKGKNYKSYVESTFTDKTHPEAKDLNTARRNAYLKLITEVNPPDTHPLGLSGAEVEANKRNYRNILSQKSLFESYLNLQRSIELYRSNNPDVEITIAFRTLGQDVPKVNAALEPFTEGKDLRYGAFTKLKSEKQDEVLPHTRTVMYQPYKAGATASAVQSEIRSKTKLVSGSKTEKAFKRKPEPFDKDHKPLRDVREAIPVSASTVGTILKEMFKHKFLFVKESYTRWKSTGLSHDTAKPMLYAPDEAISIFFDDNALDKQIIRVVSTDAVQVLEDKLNDFIDQMATKRVGKNDTEVLSELKPILANIKAHINSKELGDFFSSDELNEYLKNNEIWRDYAKKAGFGEISYKQIILNKLAELESNPNIYKDQQALEKAVVEIINIIQRPKVGILIASGNIIPVNTLQAATNPNLFITAVNAQLYKNNLPPLINSELLDRAEASQSRRINTERRTSSPTPAMTSTTASAATQTTTPTTTSSTTTQTMSPAEARPKSVISEYKLLKEKESPPNVIKWAECKKIILKLESDDLATQKALTEIKEILNKDVDIHEIPKALETLAKKMEVLRKEQFPPKLQGEVNEIKDKLKSYTSPHETRKYK